MYARLASGLCGLGLNATPKSLEYVIQVAGYLEMSKGMLEWAIHGNLRPSNG